MPYVINSVRENSTYTQSSNKHTLTGAVAAGYATAVRGLTEQAGSSDGMEGYFRAEYATGSPSHYSVFIGSCDSSGNITLVTTLQTHLGVADFDFEEGVAMIVSGVTPAELFQPRVGVSAYLTSNQAITANTDTTKYWWGYRETFNHGDIPYVFLF